MHSEALEHWRRDRLARVDDLFAVHRAIGGRGPGSGSVRAQITNACIVMLTAEWQGFCRELHDEAAKLIAGAASPASLRDPIWDALTLRRRIDAGNADAADVGSDFTRLGIAFWSRVEALDRRNAARKVRLRQLYAWRNAIVHHDVARISRGLIADSRPTLEWVRTWRAACDQLAYQTDRAVMAHITILIGTPRRPLTLARAA